jgi:hypothetical protein
VIPRSAIHQGRVYKVSAENTLNIIPVEISYTQGQLAVIKSGLNEGDKIITSDLIPVIEGLKLELVESDALQDKVMQLAMSANTNPENENQKSSAQ